MTGRSRSLKYKTFFGVSLLWQFVIQPTHHLRIVEYLEVFFRRETSFITLEREKEILMGRQSAAAEQHKT